MSPRRTLSFNRTGSLFAMVVFLAALSGSQAAEGDSYETAFAGTLVKFTAIADGNPAPTFRWTKNGVPIPGATNATLTLPSVTAGDSGVYNAIATNSVGWSLSNDLILNVGAAAIAPTYVAPSFTLQPFVRTYAPEGSAFTLSAAAMGSPSPAYQWRKNGSPIAGATDATLYFSALQTSDTANYTVLATNIAGSATSQDSMLNVVAANVDAAPVITGHPSSQTVSPNSSATFKVVATGTPTPAYQWYKNGGPISGATNPWYTIAAVTEADAGTYSARVTNSVGTATSQDAVLSLPAVDAAPVITGHPFSQTVSPNNSVSFKVVASGTPSPTYQWYKNDVPISGATDPWYSIAAVTEADAGTYSARATNSAGTATSQEAVLSVPPATSAPVITGHPFSQTVSPNSSISLRVVAFGTPSPTYQWYKNDVPISGATDPWYTIAAATEADAGTYSVLATNSAGTATSHGAVINVTVPNNDVAPVITGHPYSQTVSLNSSVGFKVVAFGTPTPTYQWYKNGMPIAGATNAWYTIEAVTHEDAGTYMAVAENSAGAVESQGAALTVQ